MPVDPISYRLLSIQVGLPRTLPARPDRQEDQWQTGFYKHPVQGLIWLGRTNLAGDGQADLKNHGGPDKAVNAYSADHYPDWRTELVRADLPWGAFGENFTISGLTEQIACIGDIYSIGEARVQISQPRIPCWKLSRRWDQPDLAARVVQAGRTGWYFRVITEGSVESGMPVRLLDRPDPEWTVSRANHVMHHSPGDRDAFAALAVCPSLAPAWKHILHRRTTSGE